MTRALFLVAIAAILGLGAQPSRAQTRVFVSGSGSDANPCSLAAPCRSFQQAHNTVLPGGEIVALDAAGYGPLTISKALTVTAIGIEASITTNATNVDAIIVAAGAGDTVAIRGLTLLSGFNGGGGIVVASAKSVSIRDCTVNGFSGNGISLFPTTSLDAELDGVSSDNNAGQGLSIVPSGPALTVVATASHFGGNGFSGVLVSAVNSTGTIKATLSVDTDGNALHGIFVYSENGKALPVVMVTGSRAVNNAGMGIIGQGPVQVFVDRTQSTGNVSDGWQASFGSVVKSYMNNEVNGNGSDALNGVVQISSE